MTLAFCTVGLLIYPLLVYNFASNNQPLLLVAILAILFALRLITVASLSKRNLGFALLALCGFCGLALLDKELRVLRAYPVIISLCGAGFCLYSLAYPPSAIERFARRFGMAIPDEAITYLRGATKLWFGFFVFNAMVAGYTAVATNVAIWALYNGLISYLLIGLLLLGEWLYRRRYQRMHSHPNNER